MQFKSNETSEAFQAICKRYTVRMPDAIEAIVAHVLADDNAESVLSDVLGGLDKAKPRGRKVDPNKRAAAALKGATPEVLQALQAALDGIKRG